jgi:hypothetical protein
MISYFPRTTIAASIALCFSPVLLAATDIEFEQLREQMLEMQQQYENQNIVLKAMATRLQQLEGGAQTARYVKVGGTQPNTTPTNDSASASADVSGAEEGPVVKEAAISRSAEAVYQEQHALFDRKFTLEGGVTYSHTDRRDLLLNGFLALDAIFLGNINLDRIKADTWTFNATGRYSMSDRLQLDLNVPYIYRSSTYSSVGAGNSTSAVAEADVKNGDLGDVSAGIYYRLFQETNDSPDTVVSLRIKAPTGKDPYGIKFVDVDSNLKVPMELPTGSGVWAASVGASFIKTVDPAILFTNIAYTYNFEEDFNDISSESGTTTQATIDLGDQFSFGAGMAFALNERMSLSTSYSHQIVLKTKIKTTGSDWQDVTGSDASYGTLNFGITYGMADNLSLLASVGIGVTPDAPDVTLGLRLPYSF